jgi:hypothetical protein
MRCDAMQHERDATNPLSGKVNPMRCVSTALWTFFPNCQQSTNQPTINRINEKTRRFRSEKLLFSLDTNKRNVGTTLSTGGRQHTLFFVGKKKGMALLLPFLANGSKAYSKRNRTTKSKNKQTDKQQAFVRSFRTPPTKHTGVETNHHAYEM